MLEVLVDDLGFSVCFQAYVLLKILISFSSGRALWTIGDRMCGYSPE